MILRHHLISKFIELPQNQFPKDSSLNYIYNKNLSLSNINSVTFEFLNIINLTGVLATNKINVTFPLL